MNSLPPHTYTQSLLVYGISSVASGLCFFPSLHVLRVVPFSPFWHVIISLKDIKFHGPSVTPQQFQQRWRHWMWSCRASELLARLSESFLMSLSLHTFLENFCAIMCCRPGLFPVLQLNHGRYMIQARIYVFISLRKKYSKEMSLL